MTALMSKIMRVILTGVSMIAIIMEACSSGQSTDAIENSTVSRKCALKTEAKAMMEVPLPEEYLIDDFEITYQMPELPTGCEITALAMALNYYGYGIDKVTMAVQYLPKAAANLYYGADRQPAQGWYTENGEYVDWSTNDHGAVLIGYSEDTVTIADPISGLTEYSRGQFESVFESRGRQCVILQ